MVANPATLVTLGDLRQWPALLCLAGFVVIVALNYRNIGGATLIGIITNERGADRICAAACIDTCIVAFGYIIFIDTVWGGQTLLRAVRWI